MQDCEALKSMNRKLEKRLYVVKEDFKELQETNQILEEDNQKLQNQIQLNEIGEQMLNIDKITFQKSESDCKMRLKDDSGYKLSR